MEIATEHWAAIASALGPGWSVHETEPDGCTLHGPRQEALHLYHQPHDKRIRINAIYRRLLAANPEMHSYYDIDQVDGIGVGEARPPREVAREIARRLLIPYRESIVAALQTFIKRTTLQRETDQLAADLHAALPGYQFRSPVRDNRDEKTYEVYRHEPYTPGVYGQDVDLTISRAYNDGQKPRIKLVIDDMEPALLWEIVAVLARQEGGGAARAS